MYQIQILRCPTADSRTCDFANTTIEQLGEASRMHIGDVRKGLEFLANRLLVAGSMHDADKLTLLEWFHRDFLTGFKETGWWDNHRRINRHHLAQEDGVPPDVDLVDVLEYIVDCVMAGMARSGQVTPIEIDPNVLMAAFRNTAQKLTDVVVVKEPDEQHATQRALQAAGGDMGVGTVLGAGGAMGAGAALAALGAEGYNAVQSAGTQLAQLVRNAAMLAGPSQQWLKPHPAEGPPRGQPVHACTLDERGFLPETSDTTSLPLTAYQCVDLISEAVALLGRADIAQTIAALGNSHPDEQVRQALEEQVRDLRMPTSTADFSWLIEHYAPDASAPLYFVSLQNTREEWGYDVNSAYRFADQRTAQLTADLLRIRELEYAGSSAPDDVPHHRVVEHGWN